MGRRLQLQAILKGISGVKKVYFQPPENIKLEFPCIVYSRDFVNTQFAGNAPYKLSKRYLVTIITRDPDDEIADRVSELPTATFSRYFVTDNLHHDIYQLYF